MKTRDICGLFAAGMLLIITSCNKEKKMMEGLIGNWKIKDSEIIYIDSLGNEEVVDSRENAGELVIYEDSENPSKTSKLYDFFFVGQEYDTIESEGILITDERNKRIILQNALNDSTVQSDMIWTIEKTKKNKQTWWMFGVDSTLFYPSNNLNPGDAHNWIVWRLEMKKS